MNKECPHCHVDDFRLKDLFGLDYFHPSKCRNCGGLIRSSGWSQFLGPAVTLFWLSLLFALGGSFLPEWLLLCIVIFTAPLHWLIFARPVKADNPRIDLPPFTADPHNDKVIIVKGWDEIELHRILDDFIRENELPKIKIDIDKRFEKEFRLTFPDDIHPLHYMALINYLNYPIDLDPGKRLLAVLGKATLTSEFHGVPDRLVGKKAVFYVPEDDDDYQVVSVEVETGTTLTYSFSEQVWLVNNRSHISGEVRMLT